MQFFLSSVEGCQVDQILLSGVEINGINALVAECLSLPVALVDPFQNMSLAASVESKCFQQARSTLMVACGLALRGITHNQTSLGTL
jgi:Tfp pilus assembly PilM family ATPase